MFGLIIPGREAVHIPKKATPPTEEGVSEEYEIDLDGLAPLDSIVVYVLPGHDVPANAGGFVFFGKAPYEESDYEHVNLLDNRQKSIMIYVHRQQRIRLLIQIFEVASGRQKARAIPPAPELIHINRTMVMIEKYLGLRLGVWPQLQQCLDNYSSSGAYDAERRDRPALVSRISQGMHDYLRQLMKSSPPKSRAPIEALRWAHGVLGDFRANYILPMRELTTQEIKDGDFVGHGVSALQFVQDKAVDAVQGPEVTDEDRKERKRINVRINAIIKCLRDIVGMQDC